jgi:negative regulator of sigma E activity
MSKRKEKISAFLDNDMQRDELMSFSLSAEPDDAQLVQRYQMLGDALRGELSDSSFVDVSKAVRESLANENIVDQMVTEAKVTPASEAASRSGLFDMSAWLRPVAGMAVAVFVAVVMVFSVTEQENATIVPVATTIETQPVTRLAVEDKLPGQNTAVSRTVGNKDTDLNPYINQHLEFATQDTLQGRLPYVRAVSFESEK